MLKSADTRILREYTGSEVFDSVISPIKRQIAFMATLSLYKSGAIFCFERDQFEINRLSLCWDHDPLCQKQYDLVIENVLCSFVRSFIYWKIGTNEHRRFSITKSYCFWRRRDFIEVRMLGTTSELRHSVTSHSDSAVRPAVDVLTS